MRRRLLTIAVLVLVAAGGLWWWRVDTAGREVAARRQRAASAWADAQQCLLGAPLTSFARQGSHAAPAEELATRVHRIAAAANDGWPAQCAAHLQSLHANLPDDDLLRRELRERFGCSPACTITEPAKQLNGLAPLASKLGEATSTLPAPRLRAEALLGRAEVAPLTNADGQVVDVVVDDDARVDLLVSATPPRACTLRPGVSLQCDPVGGQGERALVAGGERVLRSRNRGGDTVYVDRAGELVTTVAGRRRGFAVRALDDGRWQVARIEDGVIVAEDFVSLPDAAPVLVADELIWLATDADGKLAMFTRTLAHAGPMLQEVRAHGRVSPALAGTEPLTCRHADGAAIIWREAEASAVALYDGGAWAGPFAPGKAVEVARAAPPPPSRKPARPAPKAVDDLGMVGLVAQSDDVGSGDGWGKAPRATGIFGKGGEPGAALPTGADPAQPNVPPTTEPETPPAERPLPDWTEPQSQPQRLARHAFTCGPGWAALTWREPSDESIHQLRCDRKGCQESVAVLGDVRVEAWWLAITLADEVLVVWRAPGGEVRLRRGPLAQLTTLADELLIDHPSHGGLATDDLLTFGAATGATFLFRDAGLRGIHVTAEREFAVSLATAP